ncbi:MAG: hypothetical protein QXQ94_09805 [Candidatus Bathyarchaeia archaeon]
MNCPSESRITVIKNCDIELRFQMRTDVSEALSRSIGEHGVLVPPVILQLTDDLKRKFHTSKSYVCIDGHSRLSQLPEDYEVECQILTWEQLFCDFEKFCRRAGVDPLKLKEDEIIKTYILRLHACREPLPKDVYVKQAEKLKELGFSLRQIAAFLGIAKSTLHDWMQKKPLGNEDLEGESRLIRRQCGFCGKWIRQGAKPIWFHPECHDKVTILIEKAKGGENRNG